MPDYKQVIVVRKDLKISPGKTSVQVAHAAVEALEKTRQQHEDWVGEWEQQGKAKVVLKVQSKQELVELFERVKGVLPAALIKDAGKTQIAPGEITAVGIGPAPEVEIDKFTNELDLL